MIPRAYRTASRLLKKGPTKRCRADALVVPRAQAPSSQGRQDSGAVATHTAPVGPQGAQLLAGWLGVDSLDNTVAIPALGVLIATLPDPHDSHLDWTYDGGREAGRKGAKKPRRHVRSPDIDG